MRERFAELSSVDVNRELWHLQIFGFEERTAIYIEDTFDMIDPDFLDNVSRPLMRVIYEQEHGRVDDWDDTHSMVFKLTYGFDLYPIV